MMGLVSAGCSSAANSRPNAALVAESKRSGSSSSGGAVASGISSAGAGVAVLRGCRSSCNRTSALVFIVASVERLLGTGAGAPMGRPRGRESVAVGSQWWTTLSLSRERAQWK